MENVDFRQTWGGGWALPLPSCAHTPQSMWHSTGRPPWAPQRRRRGDALTSGVFLLEVKETSAVCIPLCERVVLGTWGPEDQPPGG